MKIFACTEENDIAQVFIAAMGNGRQIEFLESIQPPLPRLKKWVLIVSTLYGCPVNCPICDAGGFYKGKLSKEEIMAQIDFLIARRYPARIVPAEKFKIQFARMGEPSYNPEVLSVLEDLPRTYFAPGLMPCISTIAPESNSGFFEKLLKIKQRLYYGKFQLQFSLHSTDENIRNKLIPCRKWNFRQIADYGERFYVNGDRKLTLNFALAKEVPIESEILLKFFDPDKYLIKITPINPTYSSSKNGMQSRIKYSSDEDCALLLDQMQSAGYDTIISVGELAENNIGSNCGQFITKHLKQNEKLPDCYTYTINEIRQSQSSAGHPDK